MNKTNYVKNDFELNWAHIILCNLIIGIVVGLTCWIITSPMLDETQRIKHNNLGWNWSTVLLFDIGFISIFVSLLLKLYFDWKTTYDEYEIRRPSLRGLKVIKWYEIEEVRKVQFGLHLISKKERIVISPFVYKYPQKVLDIIREHIFKYKNSLVN